MKGRESSIFPVFLIKAEFQSNELDDKGKFFIKEFQLRSRASAAGSASVL